MELLTQEEVEEAMRSRPRGLRLGEHLVRSGRITERDLYEALSAHSGIPLGRPPVEDVSKRATRVLPREVARRWNVLPYRVAMGQLHLLTSDVPTEEMERDLASLSGLEIRFRLAPPRDVAELAAEHLGP
jgi:hypothetical protein